VEKGVFLVSSSCSLRGFFVSSIVS